MTKLETRDPRAVRLETFKWYFLMLLMIHVTLSIFVSFMIMLFNKTRSHLDDEPRDEDVFQENAGNYQW